MKSQRVLRHTHAGSRGVRLPEGLRCVAITYGAEEKTSETIVQKIFDELPVP